jgi:hypothetical protein
MEPQKINVMILLEIFGEEENDENSKRNKGK